MVEAALIRSTHKDLDNASLWGQSDCDPTLKGLMGPVSSVEAGPFLIEVEALGQLDASGGFPRMNQQRTLDGQVDRDGCASGNVKDIVFVDRFRLSDLDQRNMLDQIFRGISHGGASHEEGEGKDQGREIWRM